MTFAAGDPAWPEFCHSEYITAAVRVGRRMRGAGGEGVLDVAGFVILLGSLTPGGRGGTIDR